MPLHRDLLLITGIPGTGKTWYGDKFAEEFGFVHYDLEDQQTLNRFASNPAQFIADAVGQKGNVVVTWGFVPDNQPSIEAVLQFRNCGFKLIWFDGDRPSALRQFQKRGTVSEELFYLQMFRIEDSKIVEQLRPMIVSPFDESGQFKTVEELLEEISGSDFSLPRAKPSLDLKEYLRYYFLEEYLFKEVHAYFRETKTLTSEKFFAIVIWKSNRAKTNVLAGISRYGKSTEELMLHVAEATPLDKVKVLADIDGIGIPIASAILTVCYPEEYTVVDYRACATLATLLEVDNKLLQKRLGGDPASSPEAYLKYVERCQEEARKRGLDLRTFDRMLWGFDFYEGKDGLKELVDRLKATSAEHKKI
jgi:hypothetical protein